MKAPVRLSQAENLNPYADRELLKGSSQKKTKMFNIKINMKLYTKLLAESDKKLIAMAELIREAINDLIENPNQSYDARLIENNTKQLCFAIDLKANKKMDNFKIEHGLDKSRQVRKALAARYAKS